MAVVSDGQWNEQRGGEPPDLGFGLLLGDAFPGAQKGPVTVTWDWKFVPTNAIPSDYDRPQSVCIGFPSLPDGTYLQKRLRFTLADSFNRNVSGSADSDAGL